MLRTANPVEARRVQARDPLRWWTLLAVCLSVLLVLTNNTIVNVALPSLSRSLGASTSDLQWIVDAYALVFSGLLLLGGNLGDRYGRKGALQTGLVLFGLMSIGAAAAQSTAGLIAAQASLGVGAALIYPATLAILTNAFTDARERALAIGIWAGTAGVAVALGPILGGLLIEHFSWRAVFLINPPVAVLVLVVNLLAIHDSQGERRGRFDLVGAVLSVAAMTTLVWTVIEAPRRGWSSTYSLAGFAIATVLIVAFIRRESRHEAPLLDVRLFANPRFSAGAAAISVAFFSLFGFIFMITQYFQGVLGYGPLSAGLHTLPAAITIGVVSPIAIVAMTRFGTKRVVVLGLLVEGLGFMIAATTTDVTTRYWGPIILAMVTICVGLALVQSPATEAVMGALPPSKAGAGSAVNDTTREVGGTIGVAVVGSVMATLYAPHTEHRLRDLQVPEQATQSARHSLLSGLQVAASSGDRAGDVALAVRHSFVDGVHAGSWAAAAACVLGALAAAVFLPARAGNQPGPDRVSTHTHNAPG
jgi:EmrB/QacA subfamily drug resistance transporter